MSTRSMHTCGFGAPELETVGNRALGAAGLGHAVSWPWQMSTPGAGPRGFGRLIAPVGRGYPGGVFELFVDGGWPCVNRT